MAPKSAAYDVGMERHLDPGIRLVWVVSSLLMALIPVAGVAVAAIFGAPTWVTASLAAFSALALVAAVLGPFARYRRWSYQLTDHDLLVKRGVLTRIHRRIPRTRVQYVDIQQGPVERYLGLHTLIVYTAGAGLRAVAVPGLPDGVAEMLRSELLAWETESPETT